MLYPSSMLAKNLNLFAPEIKEVQLGVSLSITLYYYIFLSTQYIFLVAEDLVNYALQKKIMS